jgi:hypothetical protein
MKLKRMSWTRHVAYIRKKISAYRVLMGKPEGRRPLGKPSTNRRIILTL